MSLSPERIKLVKLVPDLADMAKIIGETVGLEGEKRIWDGGNHFIYTWYDKKKLEEEMLDRIFGIGISVPGDVIRATALHSLQVKRRGLGISRMVSVTIPSMQICDLESPQFLKLAVAIQEMRAESDVRERQIREMMIYHNIPEQELRRQLALAQSELPHLF